MAGEPNHAERAHARFSPSATERWINCPASIRLSEQCPPQGDTEHTARGTAIHEKSEEFLKSWEDPNDPKFDGDILLQTYVDSANIGRMVRVDPVDWRPHVNNYVKYVHGIYSAAEMEDAEGLRLIIEEHVDVVPPECSGTPDAVVLYRLEDGWEVHVIDLKAGRGIVGPESGQFLTYLIGIAKKYLDKGQLPLSRYYAHVCQAENVEQPHSLVEYTWKELQAHERKIKKAIKDSETAEPNPGDKQCQWCQARSVCTAHQEQAFSALDAAEAREGNLTLPNFEMLSTEDQMHLLGYEKVLTRFFKDLREHVTANMNRGVDYPGYKLVAGRSNRKWNPDYDDQTIADELEMYGIEEPYDRKLRAFSKIEKELKQLGINDLGDLVCRPEGAPTIAAEDDKRPALRSSLEVLEDADA